MALSHSPSTVTNGLALALDPANKKSYSQNEFQYSTDMFAWCGNTGHNAVTMSRGTISSPVGTTPLQMAVTGTDPHIGTYNTATWNIAPSPGTQRWIVSIYAKASVDTTGNITIFGANSSGVSFVSGNWLAIGGQAINITTEWQRFSAVIDFNNASIANIHVRLDGPESGGTGQTVWWDGFQVERVPAIVSTPTTFTSLYTGGSTIRDLSGNSRNGTIVGYVPYSTEVFGNFNYDATGKYITLTQNAYGIGDAYTVSFWVKRTSGTGVFLYIGAIPSGGSSAGMYFESYTNTDLYTWFFGTSSSQNNGNWGANTLSTTAWTNVTMTMVTSTKTQTRYINGVQSGSPFVFPNAVTAPSGSGTWKIVDGSQTWRGSISELKIYNRALTAAEVQQNFNALRGRFGI